MVSQADRELISNFVNELRPYLETVETGVQQFAQPNRDGVTVGQAVQALMMVRGAGQILMVDGLVSIASWLVESFEKIQNNPDVAPAEATRRLSGLYSAMEDFLVALDRGDDVDPIVLRAKTIFEAIPVFGGPLPGTGGLRPRTDLDALFGEDQSKAPTDRISGDAAADTEKLPKTGADRPGEQTAEIPQAGPTVPLQSSPDAATRRVTDQPARIVPVPPQPTEELPAVDPELREIFQEEALAIITAFGDGIRELARNPADLEAIRNLNRAAHTLKGAANMTGFPLIAQIGAAIEHLFDEQLERGQPVGRDVLELVAVSWKMLRAMLPKLDDLTSFTSPSNSIVQRANVLREQLAHAVAEAETIPMDERHYGTRQPIERPESQDTDEITSIDIQVPPAPVHDYDEVDVYMVEAAPTVPLQREPATGAEVRPAQPAEENVVIEPLAEDIVVESDSDTAPTSEIHETITTEPEPQAEDRVLETDVEPFEAEAVDEVETGPFWSTDSAADEPQIDPDEPPQSEPFWTPGTEELMRAAVHTDQLIADIQGLDELADELTHEATSDEFFAPVDDDETDEAAADHGTDSGEWLDEPDGPGTDLLSFDSGPGTEPFWNEVDDSTPGLIDVPETDEPVRMEPFFEPVEAPTSFFGSPDDVDEQLEAPEEIPVEGDAAVEDIFVSESGTSVVEPAEEVAEVEPAPVVDEQAVEDDESVEPEADEAIHDSDDYTYEYVFDFEVEPAYEPDVEAVEVDEVAVDDTLFDEPVETDTGVDFIDDVEPVAAFEDDAETVDTTVPVITRPDPETLIAPAFDSDVAGVLAAASLAGPELNVLMSTVVEVEPGVVVDEPVVDDAPEIDPAHWAEMEAVLPMEMAADVADTAITEFDGMDPADDDWAFAPVEDINEADAVEADEFWTPDGIDVAVEEISAGEGDDVAEDIVVEVEPDAHEAEANGALDEVYTGTDDDSAEDVVFAEAESFDEADLELAGEMDEDIEIQPFDPDDVEPVEMDDYPVLPEVETEFEDVEVVETSGDEELAAEITTGEPDEDIVIEPVDVLTSELNEVVAGMDDDELDDLDWFEQPDEPAREAAIETPQTDGLPPGTGYLRDMGTGFLGDPGTGLLRETGADALGFGSLNLDRFLTPEGSVALSTALLDMAFATPAADEIDGGTGSPSVSVFDESSERALEIEMFETFALEAEDHLTTLNRAAMQFDRDPFASEPVIDIKRALHTLKGAAAAADFAAISEMAHGLEDELATAERAGTLGDRTFASQLFSAIEEIEARLEQRKDELFGVTEEEQTTPTLRVDVAHIDGMLNTVGEMVVNRSSFEERLQRLEATIEDLSSAANRLQRSSYLLEREANAEDAIGRLLRGELNGRDGALVFANTQRDWDTLEMDRYTEFDRLIRQLTEVGADVSAAVGEITSLRGDFDTISTRQRRLATTLQDELMGIRMVPISSLAPRLYRVVRRAAGRRGKEVSLVIEGGDTPFDKILLDTLSESLLHLLRNAVDHGIEDAEERRRHGKPENGTIRIRAFRDGSEAVIEIIDDGAGIDHHEVIRHAAERGLAVSDDMPREEALSLIFVPGFSTRDEADDISGRGLGLEIVEKTVARYKGRVAVDSVPGRGTIFSLRLPVMLSVIQAFLVTAGDGEFAIPVANVDYVVDRIDQPLTQIGESVVVETSGQIIPVVDLATRLGRSRTPVLEKHSGWIMVTEMGGKRWALVVDELHGQQEIVVKPMGRFLRAMSSLMGATILGHGEVALIVDVPALLGVDSLVTRLNNITPATGAVMPVDRGSGDGNQPRVALVVDDSLSVRRVVSRTLERHGWVAVLARDGVEALEMLDQGHADVVLTDIEMPRMDGFELVSAIRDRKDGRDVPIIVLTSRSGEKHRERALGLGANEYLVKPFQEQELIEIVENASRVSSWA